MAETRSDGAYAASTLIRYLATLFGDEPQAIRRALRNPRRLGMNLIADAVLLKQIPVTQAELSRQLGFRGKSGVGNLLARRAAALGMRHGGKRSREPFPKVPTPKT